MNIMFINPLMPTCLSTGYRTRGAMFELQSGMDVCRGSNSSLNGGSGLLSPRVQRMTKASLISHPHNNPFNTLTFYFLDTINEKYGEHLFYRTKIFTLLKNFCQLIKLRLLFKKLVTAKSFE